MSNERNAKKRVFRVIDAMDLPYAGQLVRLRVTEGGAPPVRGIKGTRLVARSPEGSEQELEVLGFGIVGGRPSDVRLARTGRLDLVVDLADSEGRPTLASGWVVTGSL